MITFSSLEPFALSSLLLAAVLGKLGKLGLLEYAQISLIYQIFVSQTFYQNEWP